MDSTLHQGSFESMNLIITGRKGILTGFGVTFGSPLNCPHSLACQPCHFLFAEEATEKIDRNLVDSLVSIKKMWQWIPQDISSLQSELQLQNKSQFDWQRAALSSSVLCKTQEEIQNTRETYRVNKHYSRNIKSLCHKRRWHNSD